MLRPTYNEGMICRLLNSKVSRITRLILALALAINFGSGLSILSCDAASKTTYDRLMEQAKFLKRTRQSAAALPLYQKLVKMRPRDAEAHAGLGWVLFELGKVDVAMQEEVKAIELNPRNANAHHHLANMYLTLNMLPQAADEFRATLALDPKKECNCGPVRALLFAYPPGSGLTPSPPEKAPAKDQKQ